LNRDKRRVGELWRELGAVAVEFADPAPFFNVNTPEELESWMKGGKPAQ
jgi:molybdopterin-guanine dinucleotide biosynthesis protein A